MVSPRATSLCTLRILSQQSRAATTPSLRRGLHITGANSAQPISNPADRASLFSSLELPELKHECRRRSITVDGSKPELVERLSNHDMLQSRAFSIAMRRINGSAFSGNSQPTTRHFNTQKPVKDSSSPVDLVYFPSMTDIEPPTTHPGPRIPILPDTYTSNSTNNGDTAATATATTAADTDKTTAAKPQIHTVADNAASPMSEVVDNESVEIDPFTLTETVGRSRQGEELKEVRSVGGGSGGGGGNAEGGTVREFWRGVVEDVFGGSQGQAARS